MEVSIREFRAHLSRYLLQVQQGQILDITSHRKQVARLVGIPTDSPCGLTRLVTSGAAQWQGGKPAGASIRLPAGGRSVSEIILEDRR
ncbi:type II toxin-antitoxin system prevent-host-death family antitoxin [Acidithiobacillus montserratensis]|uniref:Type II toxin-antitoxin system prevent-host-death family antitoxin n=1 Tax=Acidithiobacillus montserratensis TaxID=2729135 RepID=A0ACD5HC23_9PROT|nr:type II toxin-antitoxin system prevent-host-death family antitoxin [Acidithiobacillus montserratensis]MBN2679732.1 type II toxin-antitoxin system prevent-host-death family antitoxin [Acidithiobacillaceae bacterium]MBU2747928.1 type II toxin-antitoxin system prevent-host-death family antitoxin [Acidithiobacillus montserratensis]